MSEVQYHVCMIHPFDPRGDKVGGIETYVRDYITYHPEDMRLLLIGVDGFGDLEIGEVAPISFRGREFDFMPVMYLDEQKTNEYASNIRDSLTLRFSIKLVSNWGKIRRIVSRRNASVELRRVEFAPFARSLNRPFIQMLHDGAQNKNDSMSSIFAKYWFAKEAGDYIALTLCDKFYCVNDDLPASLKAKSPRNARKLDTLTTWANPDIFFPSEFDLSDDLLRVVFAGRLDLFKNPALMFKVIARLRSLAPGGLEFHYLGDGDADSFSEFELIKDVTVRHGKKRPEDVAEIMGKCHIGILTSQYEGMPRFVMEMLAAGRPVCAFHLPQLEKVILGGVSGALIQRSDEEIELLAQKILDTWSSIKSGAMKPDMVAGAVEDYKPMKLLGRIFRDHRTMQGL